MRWYLTKYTLTQGLIEVHDGRVSESFPDYVSHGAHGHGFDKIGVNIFDNLEDAHADMRQRLVKGIAAAKKKTAKLEKQLEKLDAGR
jgi:hypothetical protein